MRKNGPTSSVKQQIDMSNLIIQENMIKYKYSKINNDSGNNNNNNNNNDNDDEIKPNNDDNDENANNYNNSNNEDEIDSFILKTAVNNILNSISFYNPVKDVLDNYDVNYKSECLGLVNIGIKSFQELNFVESDKFCCSDDKIVKFAQLSEKSQYEYRIPLSMLNLNLWLKNLP